MKTSWRAQLSVLGLAALALTGCQAAPGGGEDEPAADESAAEGDEVYTGQEAEDFINEATGARTGQIVGETKWPAENCEEELIVEVGATFEREERIFTIEELGDEEAVVSSEYTGGQ